MIKALSRPNKFIICISIILILCIFVEVPIINYNQAAYAIAGVDDLAFLLFIATVLVASGIVLSDQNMWEAFHQAKGKLYSLSKSIYEDLKQRGTLNKPSVLSFTSALRTKIGMGAKQLPVTNNMTGQIENINVIDQEVSKELLQDLEVGRWIPDVIENQNTFDLYSTQYDTEGGIMNMQGGINYAYPTLINSSLIGNVLGEYLIKNDVIPQTNISTSVAYNVSGNQVKTKFYVKGDYIAGTVLSIYAWEKNDISTDQVNMDVKAYFRNSTVNRGTVGSTNIKLSTNPVNAIYNLTLPANTNSATWLEIIIESTPLPNTGYVQTDLEHGIRDIKFSTPVSIAQTGEIFLSTTGTSNVVRTKNMDQVKPIVIPSTISIPVDVGKIEEVAKGTYDVQQVATSAGAVTTGTTIGDTMSVPTTGTGSTTVTFPQTLIDTWENIKTNIQALVQSLTQVQTETATPDLTETAKNYNLPDMILLLLMIILACIRLIARFLIFIISLLGIQADDSLIPEIVKRVINFIKSAMIPGFNLSFWNLLESFMVFLFSLKIITFIKGYVGGYYGAIETRDFYADQRNRAFKGR